MKFNTVASIIISLCLAGDAQARRQVQQIVPTLAHREAVIIDETTSNASLVEARSGIPGVEAAKQFVTKKFGYIDGKDFVVKDTYNSDNGVTHTYLKQLVNGKEVFNGDFNINTDNSGNVISYGNSFYKGSVPKSNSLVGEKPGNAADAVEALFKHIQVELGVSKDKVTVVEGRSTDGSATLNNIPSAPNGVQAVPKYIQNSNGELVLGWELEADLEENWLNGFVSSNNQVVALHDWVHDASYNVWPIGVNDPEDGKRTAVTKQGTPKTSPNGWHDQGSGKKFTTTTGNNVIAFDHRKTSDTVKNAPRAEGGKNLKFDFPIDFKKQPETYVNAAISQLFYTTNSLHDIYYAHGFNEVAGNFQQNNFGKGGKQGDVLYAQAQDGDGTDNADFSTPPDGKNPRMRMFLWDTTDPKRDGDFDNGIITHEYTHGLSTRLTGGPANSNCLNSLEAGGMGEGWGDAMANILRTRKEHNRNTDFPIGAYIYNGKTIRKHNYSTSLTTNPDTYATINEHNEVHQVGATWAEFLYEVYWNLIDKHGFNPDLTSGNHDAGNTLMIRLLIDSFKLQPCEPTIIQSRDAILLADKQLTKGANKCEIWKAFAKRGLGVNASDAGGKYVDGHDLPKGC
jgi:extracellular elastinolytic metalloproteinase